MRSIESAAVKSGVAAGSKTVPEPADALTYYLRSTAFWKDLRKLLRFLRKKTHLQVLLRGGFGVGEVRQQG